MFLLGCGVSLEKSDFNLLRCSVHRDFGMSVKRVFTELHGANVLHSLGVDRLTNRLHIYSQEASPRGAHPERTGKANVRNTLAHMIICTCAYSMGVGAYAHICAYRHICSYHMSDFIHPIQQCLLQASRHQDMGRHKRTNYPSTSRSSWWFLERFNIFQSLEETRRFCCVSRLRTRRPTG